MPYCPKCDMEFVDGITVCSDCGGPLVESKEVADAMKQKIQEEELARKQAEYEAMQAAWAAEAAAESDADESETAAKRPQYAPAAQVYVKKSQQYDDLKSSASAFYLVGGALTVFSALCWTGVISLPMAGLSRLLTQNVITAMGVGSLIVAVKSSRSAKKVSGQIGEEEEATKALISCFAENYTGAALDEQIMRESGELSPEELSLKRFSLIQDILITSHDITDQSYIDMLSEEIYSRLYED